MPFPTTRTSCCGRLRGGCVTNARDKREASQVTCRKCKSVDPQEQAVADGRSVSSEPPRTPRDLLAPMGQPAGAERAAPSRSVDSKGGFDSASYPIHRPVTGGDELGPNRNRLSRVVRAGKKMLREVGPARGRSSLGGRARPEPNGIGHTRSPYVVPPNTSCSTRQLVRSVAGASRWQGYACKGPGPECRQPSATGAWALTHGARVAARRA